MDNPKLCKDCRYYEPYLSLGYQYAKCSYPDHPQKEEPNYVTGESFSQPYCVDVRRMFRGNFCGRQARFFEPKTGISA